ncbi:hypothetical protein [Millionella massiliensis]|uniref:hypothetical protein n=1 Tax=Millionella massiliensis TaxID=1871023 RepID=UPI0023A9086A|nr:hypothetical protein [Millionella massiliensis]
MSTQANTISIETLVAKRKSVKAVAISTLLIVAGVVLYLLSDNITDNTGSLYMACIAGSFALVVIGLLRICFGDKATLYLPTKSPVRTYRLYFEGISGDELVRLIEQNKFDEIRAARRKESGPVRLDIQRSKDDRFIALQVMQFVPYTYENVSGLHCFQDEQATKVASSIGNPAK